jgi:hypothetical protein
MTVVVHGVIGVYSVGTTPEARGRGHKSSEWPTPEGTTVGTFPLRVTCPSAVSTLIAVPLTPSVVSSAAFAFVVIHASDGPAWAGVAPSVSPNVKAMAATLGATTRRQRPLVMVPSSSLI